MKTKRVMTRILAFLLVIMMVFSTVEMTSFTSVAAEGEEVASDEISDEASEETSEVVSDDTSEEESEDVTEEVSEEVSEEITEEAENETSEDEPEETSEELSEEVLLEEEPENEEDYGMYDEGSLHLFTSDMVGSDFAAYIGMAITYWQDKQCEIDFIAVEDMPKTDGNAIIGKDIFNAVYNTVNNPEDVRLRIDFEETDGNSWYSWYFNDLKEEQSDFDVTVLVEETGKKGLLKITMPDTSNVTSGIEFILYEVKSESPYFDLWKEGLGITLGSYSPAENQLVMLDASLRRINCNSYAIYDSGDSYITFDLNYRDDENGERENINEVYFANQLFKGSIDDTTPFELKHPDASVSDVVFNAIDANVTIEDGVLYPYLGYYGEISVLCTYKDAEGNECVELWRFDSVPGVESLYFHESEIEYVWDGGSYIENVLNWDTMPEDRKYSIEKELSWEVENVIGNPIELVLKTDEYEDYSNEYYDGTYIIKGYGEAKVKVSYSGKEAVCTIRVLEPIKVPQVNTVYAVYGVDTTLADLDLNALIPRAEGDDNGTFIWEDDQIKLDIAGKKVTYYNAFYLVEGREPQAVRIPVVMAEIKNLEISMIESVGDDYQVMPFPADLKKGEQISMGLSVQTYPAEASAVIANYVQQEKLYFEWTDKESKNMIDVKTSVYLPRSYTAETKGKKTFKASLFHAKTKKALKTAQATLQIYEKDQFDFEGVTVDFQVDSNDEMKGKVVIRLTEDNYKNAGKKLTIKSLDTSVMQTGKTVVSAPDGNGRISIEIPYTFKKYGKTYLSVTANDNRKTTKTFALERIEYKPALLTTEAVIDKAIMPPYGAATLRYYYPAGVVKNGAITLAGKNADKFTIDLDGNIRINEATNCANGTYTVVLQIPYTYNGNAYTVDRTLKVKVTHTKNQIKVVQYPVINEFCRYEEGDILASLNITALKGNVIDATLVNNDLPYTLEPNMETGNYDFVVKPGESIDKLTAAQKKIEIFVQYFNVGATPVFYCETVKLTLKAKKIKPDLYTNSKEILLNPEIYNNEGSFYFGAWDGMGSLSIPDAVYIVDPVSKKEVKIKLQGSEERYDSDDIYQIGKNKYYVVCSEWNVYVGLVEPNQAVNAKDTITFKIRMPHWKEAITSKKTIKVQKKALNYELIDKTLTLNMNKALYQSVSDETYLGYKLQGKYFSRYFESCIVEPADSKAKKVLENNLIIETEYDHNIIARIKDLGNVKDGTALKKGTYKFNLLITVDGKEKKYPLSIKVFDMAPSKVITYNRFGTIDLLDRENSYIQLNPSVNWDNYVYGEILDMKLTGPDAHMFDAVYEDYCFRIYAKKEYDYSTAKTYQVYPVVKWRTFNPNGAIEIKGSLQKIKLTQSKVTYKAVTDGEILYGNRTIDIGFTSNHSKTGKMVEIEKIELLNYTEDLSVDYYPGGTFVTLKLKDGQPSQIKKSSGIYTLKFAVTPAGAAVNSKPTIITCKVKIVR